MFTKFTKNLLWQGLELRGEEGEKYLKRIDNFDQLLLNLLTHPKKYSAINDRNFYRFYINKHNIPQYLPPVQKDSNIYMEVQAVILEKKSKFEFDINRM